MPNNKLSINFKTLYFIHFIFVIDELYIYLTICFVLSYAYKKNPNSFKVYITRIIFIELKNKYN
jgi:hypothetical protein